jgi:hypothetical protein
MSCWLKNKSYLHLYMLLQFLFSERSKIKKYIVLDSFLAHPDFDIFYTVFQYNECTDFCFTILNV